MGDCHWMYVTECPWLFWRLQGNIPHSYQRLLPSQLLNLLKGEVLYKPHRVWPQGLARKISQFITSFHFLFNKLEIKFVTIKKQGSICLPVRYTTRQYIVQSFRRPNGNHKTFTFFSSTLIPPPPPPHTHTEVSGWDYARPVDKYQEGWNS